MSARWGNHHTICLLYGTFFLLHFIIIRVLSYGFYFFHFPPPKYVFVACVRTVLLHLYLSEISFYLSHFPQWSHRQSKQNYNTYGNESAISINHILLQKRNETATYDFITILRGIMNCAGKTRGGRLQF